MLWMASNEKARIAVGTKKTAALADIEDVEKEWIQLESQLTFHMLNDPN